MEQRKVGRPIGRRPVVSMRVHHDLFSELVEEAEARKLSISEECERRLMLTLQFSRRTIWADVEFRKK